MLSEVLDSTPRRSGGHGGAEEGGCAKDVQYRLGVRLLDVAPVTGMVIHNTLSISHH